MYRTSGTCPKQKTTEEKIKLFELLNLTFFQRNCQAAGCCRNNITLLCVQIFPATSKFSPYLLTASCRWYFNNTMKTCLNSCLISRIGTCTISHLDMRALKLLKNRSLTENPLQQVAHFKFCLKSLLMLSQILHQNEWKEGLGSNSCVPG